MSTHEETGNDRTIHGIQGEGNKEADRRYRESTQEFIRSGRVDEAAKEAAEALEGEEGAELERARKSTSSGCCGPDKSSPPEEPGR